MIKAWISFLILFLLVFPKAGIKIGILPLTVGYVALAFTSLIILLKRGHLLHRDRLIALSLLLPFQLCVLYPIVRYEIISLEFFISFMTSLFVLPWLFLTLFSEAIENLDLSFFLRFVKNGIFWVALYGIFVFLYRMATGELLVIPFLAANIHDADTLEATKCIVRGDWLKLISTYQNGIIYGVSLLMFLPFYNLTEKSSFKRAVLKLSLLLTLTRTVWIGLFLCHLFEYFLQKRWTPKRTFWFFAQTLAGIAIVLYGLRFDLAFLLDPNLGGRREQFEVLNTLSFLGAYSFDAIAEILYLGIINYFGVLGFLTFLIALASPLILYWLRRQEHDPVKQALALGLIVYMIIAWGDGAIQYIPVMAFYWMISSLLLSARPLTVRP